MFAVDWELEGEPGIDDELDATDEVDVTDELDATEEEWRSGPTVERCRVLRKAATGERAWR